MQVNYQKQPVTAFKFGYRVKNTEQRSHFFGRVGKIISTEDGNIRVQYDDGNLETLRGPYVWLVPTPQNYVPINYES